MPELIRKILVNLDGTEESMTAAEYAIMLAGSTGAELIASYVVNTRALQDLVRSRIFLDVEEQEYSRDLEADAERYLNHVARAAEQKHLAVRLIKRSGAVHQEVMKIIEEEDVDLLVLGELARVRSRRDEFYDEAERSMRGASCSVLIVKDAVRVDDLFQFGQ